MQNLISDMVRSIGLPKVKQAAGVVTRRLPIPQPLLMVGPGASARLGQAVADFGHRRVLVVTDAVVSSLGLMKPLLDALKSTGTPYVIFDAISPDAPIPEVEEGILLFKRKKCDAIIAFGGGSVMDAAKAIGISAANNRNPRELVGYFRARHGPAPIYAVPTTAGTGSEVTVAAVISDSASGTKLVIRDTRIVPDIAALDPTLMTGLPPAITAATGMDALTHAIEAYIGGWSTAYTDRMALAAAGMIVRWLPLAYRDGDDLQAREKMSLAAAYAGFAFTRANVGNVHAIAHQLGARYHTPHGLANSIMLPKVLRFCAPAIGARLAALAIRTGAGEAGEAEAALARKFIRSVETMSAAIGIPAHLDALQEGDIPQLAAAACWEADSNYPVPRRMTQEDCEALLREALPVKAAPKRPTRRPAKTGAAAKPSVRKAKTPLAATAVGKLRAKAKSSGRKTG